MRGARIPAHEIESSFAAATDDLARPVATTKIGEKQAERCEQSRARQQADMKKSFGSCLIRMQDFQISAC